MTKYCESISQTKRWKTREVMVGSVGVGAHNPVRIQSMTTTDTRDVEATMDQVMRLADKGCEIVRLTVQGIKEADACEMIKNGLLQKGYTIPIVADIHFYPPAALRVVDFVDKVRVNPGNFVDKRASFKTIEYDDASYFKELEKIEEKFVPLIEKCKRLKRAMRIGTNHGSLSDRIMNRYGDTPRGMVESALEFARVCRQHDYHDFIFSMKASNPQVMIQAYRLLVAEMMAFGWDYPLHLGVTEAGQDEDGRIKSAMGIGSLLLDGLGDTIRVSLTEDPWHEIDPCRRMVDFAAAYAKNSGIEPFKESFRDIRLIQSRPIVFPKDISLHRDGSVILGLNHTDFIKPALYTSLGYDEQLGRPKLKGASVDALVLLTDQMSAEAQKIIKEMKYVGTSLIGLTQQEDVIPLMSLSEAISRQKEEHNKKRFNLNSSLKKGSAILIEEEIIEKWEALKDLQPSLIFLSPDKNRLHVSRQFFNWLQGNQLSIPVIISFSYTCSEADLIIQAAAEIGALLCDRLGEGIWIRGNYPLEFVRNLSFGILQAARMRTFKTDFISCPSCGRTLFDLQDVTKRIRERTSHLPGVKIAIMGCIVNGPGEMADADFGYVGSRPGMIDLYVGKNCIEKNIPFDEADDRLIDLIKREGRWVDSNNLI